MTPVFLPIQMRLKRLGFEFEVGGNKEFCTSCGLPVSLFEENTQHWIVNQLLGRDSNPGPLESRIRSKQTRVYLTSHGHEPSGHGGSCSFSLEALSQTRGRQQDYICSQFSSEMKAAGGFMAPPCAGGMLRDVGLQTEQA